VVKQAELGTIVPFGQPDALLKALMEGLEKNWDSTFIIQYAGENTWDSRVKILADEFKKLLF
jgi:hypothetical protein